MSLRLRRLWSIATETSSCKVGLKWLAGRRLALECRLGLYKGIVPGLLWHLLWHLLRHLLRHLHGLVHLTLWQRLLEWLLSVLILSHLLLILLDRLEKVHQVGRRSFGLRLCRRGRWSWCWSNWCWRCLRKR